MRFLDFKKFDPTSVTLERVIEYLKVGLAQNFTDLNTGLRRLEFDNFDSFVVTLSLPANAEIGIENKLRSGVPTKRIILRSNSYEITDGATEWNQKYVYLMNRGVADATATVLFLK